MRKIAYIALTGLLFTVTGCSKNVKDITPDIKTPVDTTPVVKPPVDTIETNIGFTAADADTAYQAFNEYYYSPTAKLYHSNTLKDNIGAIWTQAIYWDMAMNVYERKKTAEQLNMVTNMYQGGYNQYDGYNWNNTTTWFIYDDMMWWVMALTRAHQITGNPVYLEKAIAGFDRVWAGSYDPEEGGMYWDFKHSGKNACINFPTVIAAMRLYNITHNTAYLDKAKSIYTWAKTNLVVGAPGRVADHKVGNNLPGYEDYTYNQGTAIGAAMYLYKQTNDTTYLEDAKRYADYAKNTMSTNGILPAEGDYNEQGVLKSIFAQYIYQLIKEGGQTQYEEWVYTNIVTGWGNRDRARNLTWRNYALPSVTGVMQSYESSSVVMFMQLFAPRD